MEIRDERPEDAAAMHRLIAAAFAGKAYACGYEQEIVGRLARAGALAVSLVAVEDGAVVGQAAFSKALIDGGDFGWYALGPLAVRPDGQGRGIGSALVRAGLDRLSAQGAAGCVLTGDPDYYRRFGFAQRPGLRVDGVDDRYVLALPLSGSAVAGRVTFHPAFDPAPSN